MKDKRYFINRIFTFDNYLIFNQFKIIAVVCVGRILVSDSGLIFIQFEIVAVILKMSDSRIRPTIFQVAQPC